MTSSSRRWLLLLLQCFALLAPALASTWYVRPDGGTRYSSKITAGQCDGTADAPYPGHGTNQHCAFRELRYLYADGSYNTGRAGGDKAFPGWGWIGHGGDTYLLRGSIDDGTSYRVGWNAPDNACHGDICWGIPGDPFGSGMPPLPSGTDDHPTRLLGEHFANCHAEGARTQIHGGWAVWKILDLAGSSHIDVECLDFTDFSNCGKSGQIHNCTNQDFASTGIALSNKTTHLRLINVRLHGLAGFGIFGPSGDDTEFHYVDIVGNAGGGWSADLNDKTTGTGRLLVQNYSILWNGCAEEYPIRSKLPYNDCTDQDHGGYGDGFGTATVPSVPGWQAHFDQGEVAYNTQDGLDALHLIGSGSSMTVTRTLAYGNMGQQIKVGGAAGTVQNSLIVGNCRALAEPIPGAPAGFNHNLDLFCRAGDSAVAMTTGRHSISRFENNTVYESGSIGLDIECDTSAGPCDATARFSYQNNIFIGFTKSPQHGYPDGDGRLPTPVYVDNEEDNHFPDPFPHPGSSFSNNIAYHRRPDQPCPLSFEKNGSCLSPGLVDQTWHRFGFGNMAPAAPGSKAVGSGTPLDGISVDLNGHPRANPPGRGALEYTGLAPVAVLDESLPVGADSPLAAHSGNLLRAALHHAHPLWLGAACVACTLSGLTGYALGYRAALHRQPPSNPNA